MVPFFLNVTSLIHAYLHAILPRTLEWLPYDAVRTSDIILVQSYRVPNLLVVIVSFVSGMQLLKKEQVGGICLWRPIEPNFPGWCRKTHSWSKFSARHIYHTSKQNLLSATFEEEWRKSDNYARMSPYEVWKLRKGQKNKFTMNIVFYTFSGKNYKIITL